MEQVGLNEIMVNRDAMMKVDYRSVKIGAVLNSWRAIVTSVLLMPALVWGDVELNFGVYTSDKPSVMVQKFRPVLNALTESLQKKLGQPVKIRLQVASGYSKGVEDLVNGRVDFARFGPASYIHAKKLNPGITILAIESKKGRKVFNGVICVRDDSAIRSIADLKGKRFAFGNKRSTIGRYLSQNYLYARGVHAKDLEAFEYLGRHDKVGAAVASGKYDAGALKESTFRKLIKKGAPLRSIATFTNVTKPWIARSGLPNEIFIALRDALISLDNPAALKALRKDGFLPGNDSDYVSIRRAINKNPLFFN